MNAASKAVGGERVMSARLFLAVLTSATFVAVLADSMVAVLLPAIKEDFAASEAQVGWVVTGFMLVMAVGVPLYGRISDFFSLGRLFCLGLLVFAVGGLVCALAPSLSVLVLGRVAQAAGAASTPALASVAVARVLPPGKRGGAFGLIASSVGVGSAMGPIVGGIIGQLFGWRILFLGSLALTLVLIPFALRMLPDGGAAGKRRFDLAGGVLLGLGAGLFLLGITQGQVEGFASLTAWGSFLGAALAATGFVWRINRVAHPFVSPKLFRNRAYVSAMVVGFFSMFANFSMFVFVPLLIVEVNKLSAGAAGLVLTPGAIAFALLSPLTGRLSDRIGVKIPILAGLTVMVVAVLFVSTFGAGASPLLVSLGMLGVGTGFAFANSPTNNAAADALPGEEAGAGMGIFQGVFFLGAGAGPAVIGAFLAGRQEAAAGALNPLYALGAAPFSDAFLAVAAAAVLALIAALWLRGAVKAKRQSKAGGC